MTDGGNQLVFHSLDLFALGYVMRDQRDEGRITPWVAMKNGHGENGDLRTVTTAKRSLTIPRLELIARALGGREWLPPRAEIMQSKIADLFLRPEADQVSTAAIQKE